MTQTKMNRAMTRYWNNVAIQLANGALDVVRNLMMLPIPARRHGIQQHLLVGDLRGKRRLQQEGLASDQRLDPRR